MSLNLTDKNSIVFCLVVPMTNAGEAGSMQDI